VEEIYSTFHSGIAWTAVQGQASRVYVGTFQWNPHLVSGIPPSRSIAIHCGPLVATCAEEVRMEQPAASQPEAAWPGRRSRVVALITAVAVGAIVELRVLRDGVQSYGGDGAEYIEHAARLAVLENLRDRGLWSPWELLVTSDASFPPLMHLLTLPVGGLVGHEATAAAATGLLWLLLLAFSVGWIASAVVGRSSIAPAAAAATLLIPAAHGFATRYYYDLPMIALLWLAAALLAVAAHKRPLAVGVGAGLLLFAAAVTKWAAIAFGPPLLLGALLIGGLAGRDRPVAPRVLAGVVCAVIAALLCLGFVHGREGDNSFAMMGRVAFAEGSPTDWDGDAEAPGAIEAAIDRTTERFRALRGADLAFYPLRAAVSIFSPLLALLLAALVLRWLVVDRRGGWLVLAVLAGHAAFLLGVMPVLDDRFALVGAPVLVIAGVIGWTGLEPRLRSVVAAVALVVAAAVALDLHFGAPAPWNAEVELLAPDRDDFPPTWARGLGLAGSVEGRGWSRADATPDGRDPLREALWQAIVDCRADGLAVPLEEALITPGGDVEWFRYRGYLDRVVEGRSAPSIGGLCALPGQPWDGDGELDLIVLPAHGQPPHCLRAYRWRPAVEVADPDGGSGVVLWAERSLGACR
jgi:hypothetical protein